MLIKPMESEQFPEKRADSTDFYQQLKDTFLKQKPRLLVVGGGTFQLDIVRVALDLGIEVAVVDRDPRAPAMALARHQFAVDTRDVHAVVQVARQLEINGVVTAASDAAVPAVSAVVAECGLAGLGPEITERCRNKLATFRWMREAGFAVPETVAVRTLREAQAEAARIGGYPIVVKPSFGAGGRGVSIVHSAAELEPALALAIDHIKDKNNAYMLLQQFVPGISVGVEAFYGNGELVRAFVLNDQYSEEFVSPVGHSLPCLLDTGIQRAVLDTVVGYGKSLGLSRGPANFDLRWVRGKTVLIEVNPRLGGNSITDLVRIVYGVDLSAATIIAALRIAPDRLLDPKSSQPAASRLILGLPRGRARYREPSQRWQNHPQVLNLDLIVRDGESIQTRVNDRSILGRCIVRGDSPEAAARLAKEVVDDVKSRIAIEVDQTP